MNIKKTDHRHPQRAKAPRSFAAAEPINGTQVVLRLARALLQSCLVSLAALMLLSLAAAAIAYANADPDALSMPLSLAVLALCPLIGGWVAYKGTKRMPLLCGALHGISLWVLFFFVSCFFSDALRDQWSSGVSWGLRGGILIFSVLGAIMGSYAPKKKRRRRK